MNKISKKALALSACGALVAGAMGLAPSSVLATQDDCATTTITLSAGTPIIVDSDLSADVVDASCSTDGGNDVWITLTGLTADNFYQVETTNTAEPGDDTALELFSYATSGGSCATQVSEQCNADIDYPGGNYLSRVVFQADGTRTYKVLVEKDYVAYWGAGPGDLIDVAITDLGAPPPEANDCATAFALPSTNTLCESSIETTYNTEDFSALYGYPIGYYGGPDAFFSWTAPNSEYVYIHGGTNFDTAIGVAQIDSCTTVTSLDGFWDFFGPTPEDVLQMPVAAATDYYIIVGGFTTADKGVVDLCIEPTGFNAPRHATRTTRFQVNESSRTLPFSKQFDGKYVLARGVDFGGTTDDDDVGPIWVRFTPDIGGVYDITATSDSGEDINMSLLRDTGTGIGSVPGCTGCIMIDAAGPGGTESKDNAPFVVGQSYFIYVIGSSAGNDGISTIT
ncbi:hypothetical protein HZA57_07460, partial [Candidatus Poribacteria bacterium]|nr:hypothetical protein [Candidatus Poribacteria bacterium]